MASGKSALLVIFCHSLLKLGHPLLAILVKLFLSDLCIAAVVDGYCSSFKSINSGVPQGSVLSPALFLLFINDLLNQTYCPIHSYADDTTLHFSTSFHRRPTLLEVYSSCREASKLLISLKFLIGAKQT